MEASNKNCDNKCTDGQYCEINSQSCKKCATGCLKCKSDTICGLCDSALPNIDGVCEPTCSHLEERQYCKNGVPTPCEIGLTSRCQCGLAGYCASCTSDNQKCATCLTGFKMIGSKCDFCTDGYEKFVQICIKSIVIPCDENCQDCSETSICNQCKDGFYLDPSSNACVACSDTNCTACSAADTCTACKDKFLAIDNKCAASCDETVACTNGEFCNLKTKSCVKCGVGCSYCKSETICGACKDSSKTANIHGVCEDICTPAATEGEYCKNGKPEACGEGLTSDCTCSVAKFCASCSEADKTKCGTCLPGFKMNGDKCEQCTDGFETFAELCLVPSGSDPAKLSGGAIAGIVIGAIVVVGGVGGGLAYYFIKKSKK